MRLTIYCLALIYQRTSKLCIDISTSDLQSALRRILVAARLFINSSKKRNFIEGFRVRKSCKVEVKDESNQSGIVAKNLTTDLSL